MSLLNWKSDFELGVATMDQEHRGLVDAMNSVYDLDQQGAGKEAVDGALKNLMNLTIQHFEDEERHMEKVGYDDLSRHKLIHKDMLKRIAEYYEGFTKGDGSVGEELYSFLTHWLTAHICHIDRKYVALSTPTA